MRERTSILYLDDELSLLELFRDAFGDDYDVRVASTPQEVRRLLAARSADVIISDQRMPEIEGTTFLREMRDAYPDSYRILLTGQVSLIEVVGDVAGGVVEIFLPKPYTDAEMRQALEYALAALELRRRAK